MSYIGNEPSTTAFLTDTFSGTNSQLTFTMAVAPANTSSVLVTITGVVQDPSTYAVSGTTLTFSQAPPSGSNNISVRYLGIPASGVANTAYRTVTNYTATAGQTSFTVPSYTVGYIDVYRNGVRLASTDYTASSGTTIILNNGCTLGDTVTTESFYVSSILNAIPATVGSVNSTYLSSGLTLTSPTITNPTISNPTISGTPTGVGVLTSGTAVASTSGTSIDFTSIPSWVKRITVMFKGVSTNGSSNWLIRLGTSGGIASTGYLGSAGYLGASPGGGRSTTGFIFQIGGGAQIMNGSMIINLQDSATNTWVQQGTLGDSSQDYIFFSGGSAVLSGVLDRVRITTVNGTDAFDAGSINILYE
jgi:hypothetical protein